MVVVVVVVVCVWFWLWWRWCVWCVCGSSTRAVGIGGAGFGGVGSMKVWWSATSSATRSTSSTAAAGRICAAAFGIEPFACTRDPIASFAVLRRWVGSTRFAREARFFALCVLHLSSRLLQARGAPTNSQVPRRTRSSAESRHSRSLEGDPYTCSLPLFSTAAVRFSVYVLPLHRLLQPPLHSRRAFA